MDYIVDKVKENIESYLMEDMEHQNKVIDFILYNPETKETQVVASDGLEEMILFASHTKGQDKDYWTIPEWDFNFDEYFFKELQNGYEIGYITNDTHYGLWNTIADLYPSNELNNENGVKKYLQFCKENNITKEYLDDVMKMQIPDIMKYYEYPIGVIEQKGKNIIMSKENFDKQNETAYIAFVLVYDLLNKEISNSNNPKCDLSYDICNEIASNFLESKEYKNSKYSTYEMLQEWLENNQDKVKEYLGIDTPNNLTRHLEDGIYVMDLGYRKEQPVALVRQENDENKQYIIAFNYRIKDNKMDWAYGYYYDDNINKAKEDFKKVLNGGNLSKTFERKDER
ncbi:MAG: hypothetical protein U0M92_03490 [Bacilli bacterium]